MACVICSVREPDFEVRSQACRGCGGRLDGGLRQIPVLVDELRGLGYVERDVRRERCSTPACFARGEPVDVIATVRRGRDLREPNVRLCADCAVRLKMDGRIVEHVAIPARPADPVAHRLTSAPINGASTGSRATGTRERSLPIRVDATDILLPVNHGARRLLARGALGLDDDQVGHLSAATILDGWVRDWATYRHESLPTPSVPLLCSWLLDRLPWALEHHGALDEFAADIGDLVRTLYGLCGHGAARPKVMEAACPSCGLLTLVQPFPEANIECVTVDCGRILTPAEYAEHVTSLIEEAS